MFESSPDLLRSKLEPGARSGVRPGAPGLGWRAPIGPLSPGRFPHRALLLGAILALVIATALVAYLERRAAELQRQQNRVIMQQVCERTAVVLVGRIRHLLDIAVLETLEGIGHPQLVDYDLPRVAAFYANGLKRHPYVDRFFLWSANRPAQFTDQVLFYSPGVPAVEGVTPIRSPDGRALGALVPDPLLGREILHLARTQSRQRTFLVLERTIGGVPYQLIIHLLWSNERRQEFFGIIGYTVNLQRLHGELLHRLLDDEVRLTLNPDPRSPRLAATLLDEGGQVVYGEPPLAGVPSATTPVDMLFFPGEPLTAWLAGKPKVHQWHLVVSAVGPMANDPFFGGWLVAAVVLLILIAVLCAITVDRQALKLSQMQADFVANVSHQLKTPLSLLSTAIQTLCLDRVPPERLKEYLDILWAQTTRITALVERILHFSRLDAGPNAYRLEPVDLVPLVRTVVERFRPEAQNRQVPIRFESQSETVMARADAAAIEQALVNLLENAVKYGDDHNDVFVSVEQSNGHAAVSVRDQGIGIHSSDLPHIFDKFYRGRNGDHGRPGFGLGLALVQSIARAHAGRVTVVTKYEHGSEFRIEIPGIAKDAHHGPANPRR